MEEDQTHIPPSWNESEAPEVETVGEGAPVQDPEHRTGSAGDQSVFGCNSNEGRFT